MYVPFTPQRRLSWYDYNGGTIVKQNDAIWYLLIVIERACRRLRKILFPRGR
jgi:hypothetical protein